MQVVGDALLMLDVRIDPVAERARIEKEIARHENEIRKSTGKLANQAFVGKAPVEVVAQERERLARFTSTLDELRDQVAQLREFGVSAAALNSGSDASDRSRIFTALEDRSLRLLYVAPERLTRDDTLEMLSRVALDLFAIDEAHCVSQWGHDFRPEYLRLREVAQTLGRPQTIAVTATADEPTRADIVQRLFHRAPHVFVRSFDRPNLFLAMRPKSTNSTPLTAKSSSLPAS